MFVLENSIAVLADLAFVSGSLSTIPKALFWFGQITNHTLNAIIIPNHIPIPIAVCFGTPEPILKGFSLAMILGVVFGTYASIYIANPVLVFLKVSQRTIVKEEKD